MRRGTTVAALVVLLGACRFDRTVPEGSLITCEKSEECPEKMLCDSSLGRCVAATGSNLRSPGSPCTEGAECQQGICDAEICCERECAASEICNLAGKEGSCQPRPPGADCESGAQCPSGYCVASRGRKFCCERACGLSEPCDLPDHEGYCTPRPAGSKCQTGAQCPSGVCAGQTEQYCCDRACLPDERCDLPGNEGKCTPRPLGDDCVGDANCPSGFCTDGVCCESRCAGRCLTCATGRCLAAEDNTDLRRECGLCGACVVGACGPAVAGTDPHGDCPAGQICSPGQTCGLAGGMECGADAECAVGVCALGRCMSVAEERIFVDPMSPAPYMVWPQDLAVSASGTVAVRVGEEVRIDTGSMVLYQVEAFTLVRSQPGAWRLVADDELEPAGYAAALSYWSNRLYASQYQKCRGMQPCGLFGRLASSYFQWGAPEVIDPAPEDVFGMKSAIDGEGRLISIHWARTAPGDLAYQTKVHRREARAGEPPRWAEIGAFAGLESDCEVVDGRPLCITADEAAKELTIQWLSPTEIAETVPYPSGCKLPYMRTAVLNEAAGQALEVFLICDYYGDHVIVWRPQAPPGSRWNHLASGTHFYPSPLPGAPFPALLSVEGRNVVLEWWTPDGEKRSTVIGHSRAIEDILGFKGVVDGAGYPAIVVKVGASFESASTRLILMRLQP